MADHSRTVSSMPIGSNFDLSNSEQIQRCFVWLAEQAHQKSPDPSTRNAAAIVTNDQIRCAGVNTFPEGIRSSDERLTRPQKYDYLIHAESAAIASAARQGVRTNDGTMLALWAACPSCAQLIVECGVRTLIVPSRIMANTPQSWKLRVELGLAILKEGGVIVQEFDGVEDGTTMLIDSTFVPLFAGP